MYFRIEAPYPNLSSTTLLPSPQVGNNLGLRSRVNIVRMMDGSRKTFVKRGGNKKTHRWSFLLSSEKTDELVDLIKRYPGSRYRVVWRGETLIGKITLNPIETSGEGRAAGWPSGEAYSVTIELVEV